nr:MAG TPA: hypothetical protein [Caudoviricetes sp.]
MVFFCTCSSNGVIFHKLKVRHRMFLYLNLLLNFVLAVLLYHQFLKYPSTFHPKDVLTCLSML